MNIYNAARILHAQNDTRDLIFFLYGNMNNKCGTNQTRLESLIRDDVNAFILLIPVNGPLV